ncbi:MAG TPA: hypothetical protein DEP53_20210 [Bacteroidetes bacterium]|nr:hypothetical protein [Bacteroidota bacterium]
MSDHTASQRGTRILISAAALVIIIFVVHQAESVVALFVWSVFIALLGVPPVLWLKRKRVPPFPAVLLVMTCMIALLLILGGVLGASLSTFSNALPSYQKQLQEQVLALKPMLASKHLAVTDKVLLEYLNPAPVMDMAVGLLAGMGLALSQILLVLLAATFILLEASSFPIKLRAFLGNPRQVFPQFTTFMRDIERYMVIKTLVSLATGILVALWLTVLGVDSPILWGFLAFLLNYVPNVGSAVAAIPAILLALVQFGIGRAAIVGAGYLVINFVLDDFIETKLMGHRLGLSTLVVFLSLLFWGGMLGPVGMVLCVPLTMTLKFACENYKSTEWIAVLLGPGNPAENVPTGSAKARKKGIVRGQ